MNDSMSLLDANLDDFVDTPSYPVPPAGAYRATIIAYDEKNIGDHPAVSVKFKFMETLELANASDVPMADGTDIDVAYMLDNEFGVGNVKALLMPLKKHYNTVSARETLEAAKGSDVMLVTTIRKDRNDAEKKYLSIKKLEVL